MQVIAVANPKGGVGKSTLSTNIAGYLAWAGHAVMLGDVDPQRSSRLWLSQRPATIPKITGWDVGPDTIVHPPKGTTHVVLDTPAGMHGKRLAEVLKIANKVLVPLQPSLFDIHATFDFVNELLANRRSDKVSVAIVGMRAKDGTIAVDQLSAFLETSRVPVLGFLRDTQNYVHLAAHGLTLWDVAPSRVERDIEQWKPLISWINA